MKKEEKKEMLLKSVKRFSGIISSLQATKKNHEAFIEVYNKEIKDYEVKLNTIQEELKGLVEEKS